MQYIPQHVDRLLTMFPPESQQVQDGQLIVRSLPDSDFWLKTHYGFERYNGHVLYDEIKGDFDVTVELSMKPQSTFDQSGLFIGIDRDNWLKTSIEYIPDGPCHLGAVVTRLGFSDWSTRNMDSQVFAGRLFFRVKREGEDFFVYFRSAVEQEWEQLRIAHLDCSAGQLLRVGMYTASPMDRGFETTFSSFEIQRLD
ncbi:DUF1349 domain-containing protein [Paenibacillus sp. WLX2291]|uniref:DUF1349 domain-containing protein n=1 Tax=Paenibacillus sp. WLX2291 TaxID=3296934 RepID=UPI003984333B